MSICIKWSIFRLVVYLLLVFLLQLLELALPFLLRGLEDVVPEPLDLALVELDLLEFQNRPLHVTAKLLLRRRSDEVRFFLRGPAL